MSFLCCCWRTNDEAAPTEGNEMAAVEVARGGGGAGNSPALARSSSVGPLPEIRSSTSRSRPTGLSSVPNGAQNCNSDDSPQREERSPYEAQCYREKMTTHFNMQTVPKTPDTPEEAACKAALLAKINEYRNKSGKRSLIVSSELAGVAHAAWQKRAAVKDGLVVFPDGVMDHYIPKERGDAVAIPRDCLAYFDLPINSLKDLPAAVMHFWTNAGAFRRISGEPADFTCPKLNTELAADFNRTRRIFQDILLDPSNTRGGLCLRKSQTSLNGASQTLYGIVAIFGTDEGLTKKTS